MERKKERMNESTVEMNKQQYINSKNAKYIIWCILISVILMAFIDVVIVPPYFPRALIKVILFTGFPLFYFMKSGDKSLKKLFKTSKNGLSFAFLAGAAVLVLILGAYFLFNNVFDFSSIPASIESQYGVTKDNYILVALYIAICNSFLEEFFFRGFAFLTLSQYWDKKKVYLFSSIIFSLYHITMLIGWGSIWIFALALIGLVVGGMIFNFFNDRYQNIYSSWIVHLSANLAINTVGYILLSA